jgi:manganese oxidase
MRRPHCTGILLFLLGAAHVGAAADSPLPAVAANDNRTPAGQLQNSVLQIHLELREGRWYPVDDGGLYKDVYAFAEEGRAPQSSGPLIRVPQGTRIHATIRNTLPLAAKVYGFDSHPGDAKHALELAPGERRELDFSAGEAGTYLYWASTANHSIEERKEAETLLAGAFVVDAPGTKADDRIFVISLWEDGKNEIPSVNGKSWPKTERLTYKTGETPRWRVLNASQSDHAMHLHGFFFTVDGVGDGERYERYATDQRRAGVTEHVDSGHVFEMTWKPDRAGNWLFHCHMVAHMQPVSSSDAKPTEEHAHDGGMGMGGLILGITVLPGASTAPAASIATAAPHKVQLVIADNPEKIPLYTLAVYDPPAAAGAPQSEAKKKPALLGPPIVLVRGETAEIEVKNESVHETSIHWHGMELESYYDGVAGWTGSGSQITPPVAAGSSFVARMTPPRAGTFIYHSHAHDDAQLVNGVYGPLIVLEPGQKYDAEHDKCFLFGLARYAPLPTMLLINGTPEPYPMKLQAGVLYRFRLINITDNISGLRVRMAGNDALLQWKVIAKDGADLPAAQMKSSAAETLITVGETYDVEFQAERPGTVNLQIWLPDFPVLVTQPLTFAAAK